MRRLAIGVTAVVLAIALVACGDDDSETSSSTTRAASSGGGSTERLSGKVDDKGTENLVGEAELELEADDYSFEPTYIEVSPGQQVAVEIENEGDTVHTFTSTELDVDDEVSPGASTAVTVTAPTTPGLAEFHCTFHSGMGMRGAFVVTG